MDKDLLDKFNKVERFHWWWEGRRKLIENLLQDHTPNKVLDIGCGTGETLTFLKTLYPKAKMFGVDMLPEAVVYTKERKHKALKADAKKLPFKNSTFDTVLILDVIEHIDDDTRVLKEAKRVLTKEGVIIITAPALSFIWSNHDKNQGHYRRYDKDRFARIAKNTGLKVKYLSYFNFFLSIPIISIRLLSRVAPFGYLAAYDSKFNYNIAHKNIPNRLLKVIFLADINLAKYISYPWGISVGVKLKKS